MRHGIALSLALSTMAGTAHAEDELTAADTAGAPLPGYESGRVDDPETPPSTARALGRAVLAVPRALATVLLAPVRGAVWVYDRYDLAERWKRLFFTESENVGLYPVGTIDTTYGVTLGARFVDRNLFGKHEHLGARAAWLGRYKQHYDLTLDSGDRFGERTAARIGGEYEQRPHEVFFGIGNESLGIETRFEQDTLRAAGRVDVRTIGDFHLRAAGAVAKFDYGPSSSGRSIQTVYDPAMLTGFMDGVRYFYGEAELRYDSRRAANLWDSPVQPAEGWLLNAFTGYTANWGGEGNYWRTGGAAQRFFWLGPGPRVLSLRVQGEGVSGAYSDVAFTDLPKLGGPRNLRGYDHDRFRDRIAGLASAEYQWDLSYQIAMSVFVDAGRVYPELDAISLNDMRVGYGVGLTAMTSSAWLAEATLASSIDGGIFLNLNFDPVYDLDPRVVRR